MLEPVETVSPAATSAEHAREATRVAFRRVFPGVMVAMFLAAIDQTVLASALPQIASRLGGLADVSWVVVSYLLAATIAAPVYGHLGDRYGRRRMLLVALAVFTVASLVAGLADSLVTLSLARALQGLGGGGLMTLAQALIGEAVPPRERGRFQGYFAAVFALSSTSGPVIGGYLSELLSWRAVFFVNLPLGVVAAWLALRIPQHRAARHASAAPLDVGGALLFMVPTLAFLFLLTSGGHRFDWLSDTTLALALVTIAGFVLVYVWEWRAGEPLIPVRLLSTRAIRRTNFVVLLFAAGLFAAILYLPLYLQLGHGIGVGTSGLLLLPITLSMVVASTVTGRVISQTGRTKPFPIAGLSTAALAFLGLSLTMEARSTTLVLALTMGVGLGLGMVMPANQIVIQTLAGPRNLGSATASISLFRSIGGALGVAVAGALLFHLFARGDPTMTGVMPQLMERGAGYLATLDQAEQARVLAHLDEGFRAVFRLGAAVCVAGAAIAAIIPRVKL